MISKTGETTFSKKILAIKNCSSIGTTVAYLGRAHSILERGATACSALLGPALLITKKIKSLMNLEIV